MSGAWIAAIVAVIAWLGLALYLLVLNGRLRDAMDELESASQAEPVAAPRVDIVEQPAAPEVTDR